MADAQEASNIREVFTHIFKYGSEIAPRGQKTLEVENHQLHLGPRQRWCNFEARKLKVEYVRREFRWYLRGDPKDLSIAEVAKLWGSLLNTDGSVNSNYGQYLVAGGGLEWVISELSRDPDSRRASAPILRQEHLREGVKDVPCTYALNFRVRDNWLNLSVHMRSQDAIWGLGNDLPCFSLFQELVAAVLGVKVGRYCQTVDSLHVYERHWDMLQNIARSSPWSPVDCPEVAGREEAIGLLTGKPELKYPFTAWLYQDVAPGEPSP